MISRLECKVPPPIYMLLFSTIAYLLFVYAPLYTLRNASWKIGGWAIIALGFIVIVTAAIQFKSSNTTLSPVSPKSTSVIVVSGIYRFSRNPMYLGMLFILSGWVLALGGLSGVIVVPLFIMTITKFQILPEERALQESFGDQFLLYKNNVRRWL